MTIASTLAEIGSHDDTYVLAYQRPPTLCEGAPPAGYAAPVATPLWRSNPAFIDAIAERERREFEESLRAQVERLCSVRPS